MSVRNYRSTLRKIPEQRRYHLYRGGILKARIVYMQFHTTVMANLLFKFQVCKSVRHHTIQINHQLDATISPVYHPDVYLQLNMFRASSRPSSGAQQLQ